MKKVVIIVVISFIILFYLFTLKINITVNSNNVKVFDKYNEEVSSCLEDIFGFCLLKLPVNVEGNVDTNVIGNYKITYESKILFKNKKIEKEINVYDDESPVITVDKDVIESCPNKNGDITYKAFDNYDNDITDKVTKEVIDNKYVLKVSDSSNNETILEIPIEYKDDENPTIKLKGSSIVYLKIGEKYNESGYTATDNCLGDITNRVKISGNVDSNKEGKYIITYSVTDDLNNKIEVTRTIYVYNKNPDIPVGDKVIYLTFDDGPSNYTNTLLDILKKYNVKATFFVTSNGSDDTIKKAYQEGHSIGIHSYSHKYNEIYKSEEAFFKDVDKVNERIKRITGEYSRILRFAGGSSNTVSRFNKGIMTRLSKEVELKGYKYFDWNVSSSDTTTKDSTKIANYVIRSLRKGNNVVLQHDTNYGSVKAVEQIIQYGLSHGYVFDALNITSPTVHHAINN